MSVQYKLELTELVDTQQGIVETTHTYWFAESLFSKLKDIVSGIGATGSPRPHPRYHQINFYLPADVSEGPNWTNEIYNPGSPCFDGLFSDVLPDLQAWENTQSGREHYTYAIIEIQ
jgi:hypothetical protein